MHIDTTVQGLHLDITLKDGISIVRGDSATGKTYLSSLLLGYCRVNGIRCGLFNCDNFESLGVDLVDYDLIILDNADLYVNKAVLSKCAKHAKFVLCFARKSVPVLEVPIYSCNFSSSATEIQISPRSVHFRK